MTRLLVFSFLLQALSFSHASAEEVIQFDTPATSLTGKLLRNYVMLGSGEMLIGKMLYLEEPITIAGNPDSENRANRKIVKNVQTILVEFLSEDPDEESLGAVVLLTGTLYNEPSGPHHTKVLMRAQTISVIEELIGEGPVATMKTHRQ